MIGTFVRFTEDQYDFLNNLSGTMSEHIRRAIDLYRKSIESNSSASSSKGGQYGKRTE